MHIAIKFFLNAEGFQQTFTFPELNTHGLKMLRSQVEGNLADGTKVSPCVEGYATSRTCEIGLSRNSGITFKSILYLLDEASE